MINRFGVYVNDKQILEDGYLRAANLRQRLLRVSREVNNAIVAGLHERGFTELRSTHTALLSNLPFEGARLTTVASRAGMTKQAMGRLADALRRLKYIESRPDELDRRAVKLTFTDTGLDLMQQSFAVMAEIERRCANRIGEVDFQRLLQWLSDIAAEFEE